MNDMETQEWYTQELASIICLHEDGCGVEGQLECDCERSKFPSTMRDMVAMRLMSNIIAEAVRRRDVELLEKVEGKKSNHIKDGININHEKDELYCCLECAIDDDKNAALDDVIKLIKKNEKSHSHYWFQETWDTDKLPPWIALAQVNICSDWGKPCKDFSFDCPSCKVWLAFITIVQMHTGSDKNFTTRYSKE